VIGVAIVLAALPVSLLFGVEEKQPKPIVGLHGVKLGSTLAEARAAVAANKKAHDFERVPTKTSVYRYRFERSWGQSEVTVGIEAGRVVLLKELFGGDWSWDEGKAKALFVRTRDQLKKTWGEPIHQDGGRASWMLDGKTAALIYAPGVGEGLPIIKLTVMQ